MQRPAEGALPSKNPEPHGFKSKASRYFNRTPSFASFKSAPATTGSNSKASGVGNTGKNTNPIYKAGRSVSSLASKLLFFKRKMAIIWSCPHLLTCVAGFRSKSESHMDTRTPCEADASSTEPTVSYLPASHSKLPWPSTGGLDHANTHLYTFGVGSNDYLPPRLVPKSASPPETFPQPQRKRSVRFADVPPFDGSYSYQEFESEGSVGEGRSRLAHRMSECFESFNGMMSLANGNDTVLHRHGTRVRPAVPHIDTTSIVIGSMGRSPSAASSGQTSGQLTSASPVSTASTAATSFGSSPRSFSSVRKYAANDGHSLNQILPAGDDMLLPPIEEDTGRFFMIPQQETLISGEP
jgi:hypothetical protein